MRDRWEQSEIINCPMNCKGMLLNNPFRHYLKCTDCKYCFEMNISYDRIDEENTFEFKEMGYSEDDREKRIKKLKGGKVV